MATCAAAIVETVPSERVFIAPITSHTSRLVRASDGATLAQQLLSLPTPGLLVSCCFPSAATALCWLTDPVPAEAVETAETGGLLCPLSSSTAEGVWLYVVSHGLSSGFKVDSAGTGGVLMLLKRSSSPMCAVGRFALAADAHRWRASDAAANLLGLLGDGPVGSVGPPSPRPPVTPLEPPPSAPSHWDTPMGAMSKALTRTARRHADSGGERSLQPSDFPCRSAVAVWLARAAASAAFELEGYSHQSRSKSQRLGKDTDRACGAEPRETAKPARGALVMPPQRASSKVVGVLPDCGPVSGSRVQPSAKCFLRNEAY